MRYNDLQRFKAVVRKKYRGKIRLERVSYGLRKKRGAYSNGRKL